MRYVFDLTISREELLKFYAGHARSVHARDRHGRRVSFPAEALRPFVGSYGISGTFEITADRSGRLQSVHRLA